MKRIIISTDSVNVYGYRLLSNGCDLSLYNNNPILLFMHERGLIIGKLKDIKIENGQITAEPEFAPTEKGKECQILYEQGFLNMASVWAEPIEWSEDTTLMLPGQTGPTVIRWYLKETSLVDVAGNKDCIKLVHADGTDFKISDFQKPIFNKDSDMKKIALFLKLSDSASEDAILEVVSRLHADHADMSKKLADKTTEATALASENKTLKEKMAAQKLAEFESLLNSPKKKLTDAQKATFKKLFAADEEAATEAVKSLPDYQNLSDSAGGTETTADEYKGKSWDDLDRSGKLADVKEKQPELYKTLFKAKFGKEPRA